MQPIASRASVRSSGLQALLLLAGIASLSHLHAATYYVATNGDDARTTAQAQSINTPWKTINKAAQTMGPGDICLIRGGTYPETAVVLNSGNSTQPITFQAYGSEVVTITGLSSVTGWTMESTNVWYASAPGSLGDGNQIFQNSVIKPEARWPNAGSLFPWQDSTLAHPTFNELGNWSYANTGSYNTSGTQATNGTFTDPQLPNRSDGYWVGATVHMLSGHGWIMAHPTVTAYTNSSRTVVTDHAVPFYPAGTTTPNSAYAMAGGNEFYLTGKKNEMDSAGEWFYDTPASRLYFYSTAAPTGVEMKKRSYGFNLTGKSYIRLINLDFFACTLLTDTNTNNITYDGLFMRYLGHSAKDAGVYGIDLRNNDTLRNSELRWDSRGLIRLRGSNIRVINNNLRDSGYVPTWTAMVDAGINTIASLAYKQNLISRNTLRDSGRSLMGYPGNASIVEYNDMINGMRLTTDGGIFYSNLDGGNSVVRYNILRDSNGPVGHSGAPPMGFYLDSQNTNWIVHHNIISNIGGYVMHINARTNFNKVYNNTCWSTNPAYGGPSSSFNGDGETGSSFFNNIFASTPLGNQATWNATDLRFNAYSNPGFVTTSPPFRLLSNSSAINAGTAIPGVTTNTVGAAPDLGAQEDGAPDWTPQAGYHTTPPTPDPTYNVPEIVFVNKVKDQSFESGVLAPNWSAVAGSNVAFQAGHSWNDIRLRTGGYSLRFGAGSSEVKQTVTGLISDRRYKLHVGVQTADPLAVVNIGVRNHGYSNLELTVPVGSGEWVMDALPFITGSNSTTAEIYVSVSSSSSTPVYVDDIAVVREQSVPPLPETTPMVQYHFDQSSGTTALDGSVNARNATISGATTPAWQTGVIGNGLGFDGVDDYVQTPSFTTPSSVTIACWAKSAGATWGNNWGCFVSQRPSFFFTPYPGTKNLRFTVYSSPTASLSLYWTAPAGFDITAWHHYVAVFSPTTQKMQIYVDGVLSASAAAAITMQSDTGPVYIGKDEGFTDRHFAGAMDDVRIYDRALTSQEIGNLFGADDTNILRLAFDESSGATKAWDASGRGRTGTLTSMAPATAWVDGEVGGALSFDGVDDHVVTTALPTPAALTVACWAKSNTATWSAYGCLVSQRPAFVLHPEQGSRNVRFIIYADATNAVNLFWTAPANFDITLWHHYAGVFNPVTDRMEFYVDGVLVNSLTTTAAINPDIGAISIGRDDGWARYLNGRIDDVRIYSRALSSWELLEISDLIDAPPYY